jgi:hypothetical protein
MPTDHEETSIVVSGEVGACVTPPASDGKANP